MSSNVLPWQALCARHSHLGAKLRVVARPVEEIASFDWTQAVERSIMEDSSIATVALPNFLWTDGSALDLVHISRLCQQVGGSIPIIHAGASAVYLPNDPKTLYSRTASWPSFCSGLEKYCFGAGLDTVARGSAVQCGSDSTTSRSLQRPQMAVGPIRVFLDVARPSKDARLAAAGASRAQQVGVRAVGREIIAQHLSGSWFAPLGSGWVRMDLAGTPLARWAWTAIPRSSIRELGNLTVEVRLLIHLWVCCVYHLDPFPLSLHFLLFAGRPNPVGLPMLAAALQYLQTWRTHEIARHCAALSSRFVGK